MRLTQPTQKRSPRTHFVACIHEPHLLAELVRFLRRALDSQSSMPTPRWEADNAELIGWPRYAPWQDYRPEERGAARPVSAWLTPSRVNLGCNRLQRHAGASCRHPLLACRRQTLAAPAREAQPSHPASYPPAQTNGDPTARLPQLPGHAVALAGCTPPLLRPERRWAAHPSAAVAALKADDDQAGPVDY